MTVRIVPLGGLGEVGMNAMLLEQDGRRVLVDAGVMFPRADTPGVEVAVPDLAYVREAGGLDAVVLTHAHEDHIGALPTLLREFPAPVFATPFTLRLVAERLKEFDLSVPLHAVEPRQSFEAGPFRAEPLRVAHSIPDGVGYAFETGEGVVVHTGDWKLDLTPGSGDRLDLARFSDWGRAGVAALLSDSTNAEREGFSVSESAVAEALLRRIRTAPSRVVVALFASHVHRVQSLLGIAAALGRKVVLAGRSLQRNMTLAAELGVVEIPPGVLVDHETAATTPASKLIILCSGAQAEPMSALSRLAAGDLKPLLIEPGDLVLFSARAIPGNERAISELANRLARRGADVVDRAPDPIHASGHAQAEEQRILLDAVQPRHFVPIHGEYRMLVAHARTAIGMGLAASEVFVVEDGETLELADGRMRLGDVVAAGRIWLDSRTGPLVPEAVLKERLALSEQGAVAVLLPVDEAGRPAGEPDLLFRGLAEVDGPLQAEVRRTLFEALGELAPRARLDVQALETAASQGVRRAFRRLRGRKPVVMVFVRPPGTNS
ncbi:MAG: hypothetical protein RL199_964 [Pseudomonadota bacterium]|jgi:ribonuclease J